MRRLLLVAVMCGAASGAQAADMPDLPFLRGSFTEGLSTASVNWERLLCRRPGCATAPRTWTSPTPAGFARQASEQRRSGIAIQHLAVAAAGKAHMQSSGFGGFVGYNSSGTDVVIGVEAELHPRQFVRISAAAVSRGSVSSPDRLRCHTADRIRRGLDEAHRLTARCGCAAATPVGNFLPYGLSASRWGRPNINRRADVTSTYRTSASAVPPLPIRRHRQPDDNDQLPVHHGFAGGAGIDVML